VSKYIKLILIVVTFNIYANNSLKNYKKLECKLKQIFRKSEEQNFIKQDLTHAFKSNNWSGYASLTNFTQPLDNSVTAVSGTWNVPQVFASSPANKTYSSIWVGIDGFSNNTVEQIGTEQDFINGRQSNYAWFEMFPRPAFEIVNFPVHKNDSITASVVYIGAHTFILSIFNNTKRVYTFIPPRYTQSTRAKRSSAEWIVEAPALNRTLPLARFSKIDFKNCNTVIKGILGSINVSGSKDFFNNKKAWKHTSIVMTKNDGTKKAIPSGLSNHGKNFNVVWKHQ